MVSVDLVSGDEDNSTEDDGAEDGSPGNGSDVESPDDWEDGEPDPQTSISQSGEETSGLVWLWVLVIVIIVVVALVCLLFIFKRDVLMRGHDDVSPLENGEPPRLPPDEPPTF